MTYIPGVPQLGPENPDWGWGQGGLNSPWLPQNPGQNRLNLLKPGPPQNLVVSVPAQGLITCTFTDVGSPTGINYNPRRPVVSYWQMVVCAQKNAPQNPTGADIVA